MPNSTVFPRLTSFNLFYSDSRKALKALKKKTHFLRFRKHKSNNYSFAEIHRGESMLPSRNPCSHQHVEQGLMIPLDFLQVRARSGIGKNDLPGGPGPQGPTDPLEAQGGLRERHPRRGHLEPAATGKRRYRPGARSAGWPALSYTGKRPSRHVVSSRGWSARSRTWPPRFR
jgi:hypothetical protein